MRGLASEVANLSHTHRHKVSMKGFDPEFRDLPHYIYAITARIWEGQNVELIRRHYSKDCPVRSPTGLVVGAEQVITSTLATQKEFPDRRLLGEDVVWKEQGGGYLSSHRIMSTATHHGDGTFGKATNLPLRYRVIADCWCKNNQVVEEWLVRDQGAIARELGLKPRDLAAQQVERDDSGFFLPEQDVDSDYDPDDATDDDAKRYRDMWKMAWEESLAAEAVENYHHAATIEGPSGLRWVGRDGAERFFQSYVAAVDSPVLAVHDLFACDNERGKTVAMRWSVSGKSSGEGFLDGGRQGKPVYMMGISHARFVSGRIDVEWVLVDEVALWKQVL